MPIVTLFGLDLGALLGGAILTEKVFSMQGLGELLISAVGQLDVPVVVGVTLFSAFLIVLANLLVDLAYSPSRPRVSRNGMDASPPRKDPHETHPPRAALVPAVGPWP